MNFWFRMSDRFQGDQVSASEGSNLRHHHGFEPQSFTDFDIQQNWAAIGKHRRRLGKQK
jgi:hypothetical protein